MGQAVITHKGNVGHIETVSVDEEIPAELLMQRDRTVRYQRNGTVYATDGRVGVLKRVVVDEHLGEVAEVVIETSGRDIVLPVEFVDRTAGSAVFLTTNRAGFTTAAAQAPTYDLAAFTVANVKSLLAAAAKLTEKSPRRGVNAVGKDHVETPSGSLLDRIGGPVSASEPTASDDVAE